LYAFDPLNGDFSKADPLDVRIVSYNHNQNFISDPGTDAAFDRILIALDPDVICFQEFTSSVSQSDVTNRLDSILPTPGGWQIHFGLLGGIRTVIASRYPLTMKRTDTIPQSSTRGVTIALVDLPDPTYAVDLYLLGVHLKCCGDPGGSEDQKRQKSADAIANWLGDARGVSRPSGDNVVLPSNTPMIVLGDFNFVGGPQPELTLRTGNIIDEGTYGPDVKGDWDNSDLTDLVPVDPFTGDNFTWQGSGWYPPSRLDRFYYTDSVVAVASSFILNTDTMTSQALNNAGLHASDTLPSSTSDHLPIVMDVSASSLTGGCTDTDGDGVCDPNDGCPSDPNKVDPGLCGCGVPDTDTDADGTPDCLDNCSNDPNKVDPGVCGCGVSDRDTDGDGTPDCLDYCPEDPNKVLPGICGCGVSDVDTDSDGTPDCFDLCPDDPNKVDPGLCGCGAADADSDSDGIPDCLDPCPNDPNKVNPGVCGCGIPDIDTDGDGIPDCVDSCPDDPNKVDSGQCGCGVPDVDSDGDGTADCLDWCPNDPNKIDPGVCGCGTPDTDSDGDTVPDCIDVCPGQNDTIDNNGNGIPDCAEVPCPGDVDGDLDVDLDDLTLLLSQFGQVGNGLPADLDSDSDVDLDDLTTLLASFGRSCV